MRIKIFFIIVLLLIHIIIAFSAEEKNLKTYQSGNRLVIEYDLEGEPNSSKDIDLIIITKDKALWKEQLSLEGDIEKVKPGKNKKIYWNILKDFPNGISEEIIVVLNSKLKFKIDIDAEINHYGFINFISYTTDGKYIASCSSDKTIKIWETKTGEYIKTLKGHSGGVYSVSFSSDNIYLASGSSDNTIKIWDVKTGQLIRTLQAHNGSVYSVSFSSDGKYLASGSEDKTIKLWDAKTGQLIRTLNGHKSSVNSVSFSSDSKYLASGSSDKTIKLWSVSTGKISKTLNYKDMITVVLFSPDSKNIAFCSKNILNIFLDDRNVDEYHIKIWDFESVNTIASSVDFLQFNSASYSLDGLYIISGHDNGEIKIWDAKSATLIKTISGHTKKVTSVSFSPDGKYFASVSDDASVKLWDSSTSKLVKTFNEKDVPDNVISSKDVRDITFSPDNRYFAFAFGSLIMIWDLNTKKFYRIINLMTDNIDSLSFSPDGKYIIFSTFFTGNDPRFADPNVYLINVDSARVTKKFDNDYSFAYSAKFSPDGSYFAYASDNFTILRDIKTGKFLKKFNSKATWVSKISISSDGRYIAAVANDNIDNNILELWDVHNGKLLRVLDNLSSKIKSLSFSPDSKYLIFTTEKEMSLWSIESGEILLKFFLLDDGEWLVVNHESYYNCSENGDKFLKIIIDNNSYDISKFKSKLHNSEIIKKTIK